MSHPDLFAWQPSPLPSPSKAAAFDGRTYAPDRDYERLTGQLKAVYDVMRDGRWRTIPEIGATVIGSEAAISARLRDLRKDKYGAHEIQREHVHDGLWRYRLKVEDAACAT